MIEFDWDQANLAHIALHSVQPNEAEEALQGMTLEVDTYVIGGEQRFEELGRTLSGRILRLVSTPRSGKIRVVTAFDPSASEKRSYQIFERSQYE